MIVTPVLSATTPSNSKIDGKRLKKSDKLNTISCWYEHSKLFASDAEKFSSFGISISNDVDKILIGSSGGDGYENQSGAAYVFKRNGTNWSEEAKLIASDGKNNDRFGRSVSLDGDTSLIGAYGNDDNGNLTGSAYVYRYNGSSWNEEAKILASDGETNDYFGYAVSLYGDYALIGAFRDNDNGHQSGSAYVFKRNGTNWSEEAKLIASDGKENAMFGISVSLNEDYAIIGAFKDYNKQIRSGSAYVFKRNGTNWSEEAKLIASDGKNNDRFGCSVSLDGETALIGAEGCNNWMGSAYIYRYNGASWNEEAKIRASDGYPTNNFGDSVYLDGDNALIGAYRDDNNNGGYPQNGSAYFFKVRIPPVY